MDTYQTLLAARALQDDDAEQQQLLGTTPPDRGAQQYENGFDSLSTSSFRQRTNTPNTYRDNWSVGAILGSTDQGLGIQPTSTATGPLHDNPNLLRAASLGAAEALRQFEPPAALEGRKTQRAQSSKSAMKGAGTAKHTGGSAAQGAETVTIHIDANSRTSSNASDHHPLLAAFSVDGRRTSEPSTPHMKHADASIFDRKEAPSSQSGPPAVPRLPIEKQDSLLEEFDEDAASVKRAEPGLLGKPEFWAAAVPGLFTLALLIAGICLLRLSPDRRLLYLEAWRWCFFFAGAAPIYYSSEVAVRLGEMVVESRFFTTAQALYFAVSIQKPVARFLRALMLLPLFMLTFSDGTDGPPPVQQSWRVIIKILICLVLLAGADVLKTLLAKIMASHFHKKAHFEKMQDALNKEYFLHSLSQPRPHEDAAITAAMAATGMDHHHRQNHPNRLHHMRSMSYAVYNEVFDAVHTVSQSVTHSVLKARRSARMEAKPHKQHSIRSITSASDLVGLAAKAERSSGVDGMGAALTSDAGPGMRSSNGSTSGSMTGKAPGGSPIGGERLSTTCPLGGLRNVADADKDQSTSNSPRQPRTPLQRAPDVLLRRGSLNPADADFMRRLHNLETHIRENKLKMTFTDELGMAQADSDGVGSKKEAKKLAFYLFWNVRQSFDRNYIVFEDLTYFLPAEKAAQALKVLDVDGDGKISLHDIRDAVIQIYKERKNLAFTLKDTRTVVGKLEYIIGIVIHILCIFFYLIIFNVNVGQVWLTFSSIVLAFVFVFGNSLRNIFESVVFLFVVHPYDVGDVLLVNETWCKVEEIAIQNTTLLRWDGVKIFHPNHLLSNGAVMNVSRSANRWEGFKVAVDIRTGSEVFDHVEKAVTEFFKVNPTEYTGEKLVVANFAGDPLKFTLCVWWEYAHSGVELGRMSRARHALYMAVSKALLAANVAYTLPPYQDMGVHLSSQRPGPERPRGEGQAFMPPFMQKSALKL